MNRVAINSWGKDCFLGAGVLGCCRELVYGVAVRRWCKGLLLGAGV